MTLLTEVFLHDAVAKDVDLGMPTLCSFRFERNLARARAKNTPNCLSGLLPGNGGYRGAARQLTVPAPQHMFMDQKGHPT
jgi:hypothetical protein